MLKFQPQEVLMEERSLITQYNLQPMKINITK